MAKSLPQLNIFMLSHRDFSLVGGEAGGDAVERHVLYGQHVQHLDIIMHSSQHENLPVHRLAKNVTVHPTNSRRRLCFLKDAMTLASGIAQVHRPDLIVSQDPFVLGWAGMRLKKKFRIPLLVHFHGDFWDNPYFLIEHATNRLLLPLSFHVVKNADAVRVVSPLIAEKIKKRFPEKYVAVISTPVDLEKFLHAPPSVVAELKQRYGAKLILYVGRVEVEKNLELLLSAFELVEKKIPEARLLIIGQGSQLGMLREEAAKQGWVNTKVFFRGNVSHEELPAYYHAACILALSSNSESFGKVILEAAAAGIPAVATATTGARTLIQDKITGFLVKIGDVQGFAAKLISFVEDETLRSEMGKRAREHALANYSQAETIKKVLELWEKVANQR